MCYKHQLACSGTFPSAVLLACRVVARHDGSIDDDVQVALDRCEHIVLGDTGLVWVSIEGHARSTSCMVTVADRPRLGPTGRQAHCRRSIHLTCLRFTLIQIQSRSQCLGWCARSEGAKNGRTGILNYRLRSSHPSWLYCQTR